MTIAEIPEGTKIEVQWPVEVNGEDAVDWVPAVVTGLSKKRKYNLRFDDGEEQASQLAKKPFVILDGKFPTNGPRPERGHVGSTNKSHQRQWNARMGNAPTTEIFQQILAETLAELDEVNISRALHQVAKKNVGKEAAWKVVGRVLKDGLDQYSGRSLAMMMWSLGSIGAPEFADPFAKMADCFVVDVANKAVNQQEMSMTVWAMGQLGAKTYALASAVSSRVLESGWQDWKALEMANLISGLARSNALAPTLLQSATEEALRRNQEFSEENLAMLASALVRAGDGKTHFEPLVGLLSWAVEHKLKGFNAQDVAHLTAGLAASTEDLDEEDAFCALATRRGAKYLEIFEPVDVVVFAKSLAELKRTERDLVAAVAAKLANAPAGQAPPDQLADLVWAVAELGFVSQDDPQKTWLTKVVTEGALSGTPFQHADAATCAKVAYGVCALFALSEAEQMAEEVKAFLRGVLASSGINDIEGDAKRWRSAAHAVVKVAAGEDEDVSEESDLVDTPLTDFEKELLSDFNAVEISAKRKVLCFGGHRFYQTMAKTADKRKVVFEARGLGVANRQIGTGEYTSTGMQAIERLLAKQIEGVELVVIDGAKWKGLGGRKRRAWLKTLV